MRNALVVVGIAAIVVIIGGWYAATGRFTTSSDSSDRMNEQPMASSTLSLTSPEFEQNGKIPSKFTCDGQQVNPPLQISGVPGDTKTLVLIMDDPDVPKQLKPDGMFDHWILFNLPAGRQVFRIEEGQVPEGAIVGANGAGKSEYTGPCPPTQYEPSEHRYFFKLYALDTSLPLKAGASKADVERAMEGHILAQAQLVGRYSRK